MVADNVDVLSVLMGTAIDKNAKEKVLYRNEFWRHSLFCVCFEYIMLVQAHGRTALMMALESGMQQVAIYLLEHNCDLSITDTVISMCLLCVCVCVCV